MPTFRTAILVPMLLAAAGQAIAQPMNGGAASKSLMAAVVDFRHDDADFMSPDLFSNAGSVSATLGDDGYPVYKGGGKQIVTSAMDQYGRTIAAHMVNPYTAGDLPADEPVYLTDSNGVLAYAINLEGVTYNDDGTSTWTYYVEEIPGGKDLSHWNLALDAGHGVVAGTTPGYDLGVDGSTGFYGIKWDVTDDFSSGYFDIVLDQHYDAAIRESGVLAKGGKQADTESILAPSGEVVPSGVGPGCVPIADTAATLGDEASGGIGSMNSFVRWFKFLPGTNLPGACSIVMHEIEDGVFEFSSEDFCPINGQLYGNDPTGVNRDFTLHIHAEFEHAGDLDQFLTYVGDGDCWVFINGELMIDLTGAQEGASQTADVDRLCLEPGTHTLDLFYAQRGGGGAITITTNLDLSTNAFGPPPTMALHD